MNVAGSSAYRFRQARHLTPSRVGDENIAAPRLRAVAPCLPPPAGQSFFVDVVEDLRTYAYASALLPEVPGTAVSAKPTGSKIAPIWLA